MANAFVHVELNTTDVEKAKKFYGSLFDWTLEDMEIPPVGRYTMIKPAAGTGGGMMKQMMPGQPSAWLAYVEVGDVEASTAKARSLGAKVMVENKAIGDIGWLSIIEDPTGAMLGLWKPKMR